MNDQVKKFIAEGYRRFPDEVHQYTDDEISELAALGVQAHPAGKITSDLGSLRYAFLEGALFAAMQAKSEVEG